MAPALRTSEILAGRTCGKVTPLALGKMLERENFATPRWVAGGQVLAGRSRQITFDDPAASCVG